MANEFGFGGGAFGMPGGSGGGGFTGGGSPTSLGGTPTSTNWSPPQMQDLLKMLLSQTQGGVENINNFIKNPLSSELFQNTVNPILAAMQPRLQAQQTAMTDAFRATGGLRDTSYRGALTGLMGEQATQMGGVVGGLANQVFNNLLNALQTPTNMVQQSVRSMPMYNQGNTLQPRSGGGGGGGGGGPTTSGAEFDARQAEAIRRAEEMRRFNSTLSNTGQPEPGAGTAPQGPSIWDILNQGGLSGGGAGGAIGYDPNTGSFVSMPSEGSYDSGAISSPTYSDPYGSGGYSFDSYSGGDNSEPGMADWSGYTDTDSGYGGYDMTNWEY